MNVQSSIDKLISHDNTTSASCRFCNTPLRFTLVDLGMSPLCESYLQRHQLNDPESFYPLRVYVCQECYLAQLEQYVDAHAIFSEYAYFSSYADSWVEHARSYVEMIVDRLQLGADGLVIELASNDGYLLQHFLLKSIPVLGIEPAANVAKAAEEKGVPTLVDFFGKPLADELVRRGTCADLLIGNNVLAQVPDLNDFIQGMKTVLKPNGVLTMEFPHLLCLMRENQFDTIYHEHFSYFSLLAIERIFGHHGLSVFDVETLSTHGGSLRVYARHTSDTAKAVLPSVDNLRRMELEAGLDQMDTYSGFAERVMEIKRRLLEFLIIARRSGKQVVGYGAPGKGNTLLNYCGVRTDFLDYTVDRNPYKQGRYLPGTHIPIYAPDRIRQTKPDYVLILPWNFKNEIVQQNSDIRDWGGRFVVPIPELEVF